MTHRSTRSRWVAYMCTVLGAGAILLSTTQTWVTISFTEELATQSVAVQGTALTPATVALGYALLALIAVTFIVSALWRRILSIIGIILAGGSMFTAVGALQSPRESASGPITDATGITGSDSIAQLVTRADLSVWPWVAIGGGTVAIVGCLLIAIFTFRWPQRSHRYDRMEPGQPARHHSSLDADKDAYIDDWDSLSRGQDPT